MSSFGSDYMPPAPKSQYSQVRAYVMRKSWYSPKYGPYAVHYDKEVRGYTYKPEVMQMIDQLNAECKQCPRRTAQKTHYYLQENMLSIRVKNE